MTDATTELARLVAGRFIARTDVRAMQVADGGYRPVREPWHGQRVVEHLTGAATFGHYMLDAQNQCKYFAFDCDLRKGPGEWVQVPDEQTLAGLDLAHGANADAALLASVRRHYADDLRANWHERSHPGRAWWKFQMRSLGDLLSTAIHRNLGIPTAVAYSGNKGIHVYGFTGLVPAAQAREAAKGILAITGRFAESKGSNFYADTNDDWFENFSNFEIEVFPKQDAVDPGHFGNLMRLPLGVNRKNPQDPTFFVDQRIAQTKLAPHPDPIGLLREGNPWL
ncbi:DNA primase/polymerase [Rhodococcus phage Reynauld]|uniref:DNA primase/polymerase n=1 Tax=Rhodococcus phage Reynauld TaxID=3062845 RepID=A0ACD4UHF8_9CAUD|nr:DNA primase/polymerase [Rhodococcus phage Reynauld]